MKYWSSGGVCLCLVLAAARVSAQPTPENLEAAARTHFELGRDHYEAGRFDDAAREFREAYRLSQRPELLYNIHVAERDAGNLVPARDALRAFLDSGVSDATRNRAALEARLTTLDRQIARGGSGDTAPPAEEGRGPPAFAWGLVIAGGASTAAAIVLGVLALSLEADLEERCADGVCRSAGDAGDIDTGNTLTLAADVTGIAGLVALAVGAIVILASGGDTEADSPRAAREGLRWRF